MVLTYAIGDIHGRNDLLQALLHQIREHADDRPHKLVFLGDYIDRGLESAQVIETVRTLEARSGRDVVCLKGNHEAMLLSAIAKPELAPWWMRNGGDATLVSYGLDLPEDVPADVLAWMEALPLFYEDDHRCFVHAGLRPGRGLRDQTDEDRIWIREPFIDRDYDFGKHVVHGHTPTVSVRPDVRRFRTNLDTGAVYGGALTAGIFTDDQGPPIDFLQVS